jgi:acyl-CoA thioesterase FadM
MLSPVHEYTVLIIERHLDTFGHVNNATYLDLFEAARWEWITSNGFGLERIRELRKVPSSSRSISASSVRSRTASAS